MKHNWEYKRLGEVCCFERGVTYTKADESQELTKIIILRSNNINLSDSKLNFDDLKYLRADFDLKEKHKLKNNSILICMSNGSVAHVGKTAFIDKDMNFGFGGFMGLIKPIEENPKYIFYIFKSKVFKNFLSNINRGANIRNLQFSKLEKLIIPVPPREVQEQIVAELDAINEGIAELNEQIKDLDSLAQTLFYENFGDPITNSKDWPVKKIKDIGEVIGGSTPKTNNENYWNGDLRWITPAELKGPKYIFETERHITEEGRKSARLQLLPINTVLLTSRAPIGKVAIVKNPMYCNQGFKNILFNENLIHHEYLFYLLLFMNDVLQEKGKGPTFKEISKKVVENILIPIPPLSLQQQFAAQIEEIEKMKRELEAQIAEVQTLHDSRMDYWFN